VRAARGPAGLLRAALLLLLLVVGRSALAQTPGEGDVVEPEAAETAPPDVAVTAPDAAAAAPAAPSFRAAPDPRMLDRIVREGRTETEDSAPFGEYARLVRDAVLQSIGIAIGRSGVVDPALRLIPYLLLAAVAGLLIVLVAHLWRSWRPVPASLSIRSVPLEEEEARTDHRLEAERLLSQGRMREAFAALWRHLTEGLADRGLGRSGPELTHREFVRSVGRMRPDWDRLPELTALARTADVLVYGSAPIPEGRVRELFPVAERLLR